MCRIFERPSATTRCSTKEKCKSHLLTNELLLTVLCRIARYAAAYARSNQHPAPPITSNQAASKSKAASNVSRSGFVRQAQASRGVTTHSSVELHSLDTCNQNPSAETLDRGWNPNLFPESPSNGGHRQPSIFPGVVRQRTRRKSLRQSSGSENDYDAFGGSGVGLSSSGMLEPDGKGPSLAVPEETQSDDLIS